MTDSDSTATPVDRHCYAADELHPQCGLKSGDLIQRRPCGPPCRVESVDVAGVKVREANNAYWITWLTLNIAWKRCGDFAA
jgi:hypothetical protein